ncbi:hypothetical protein WJX77_007058 [Trebouxia sp. C0004]
MTSKSQACAINLQASRYARWWQSRRASMQKSLAAFRRKQKRVQIAKSRRPWLRCSLVVTEQDGQEEVALKLTEMPPRQMTIPVDDPTYDSDEVVRNLVEWAADGGDFVFQGMESLSLTPERLLKHLALVVTGEAEDMICPLCEEAFGSQKKLLWHAFSAQPALG